MNAIAFAMEKERQAERYYRDLARQAHGDALVHIMTLLADAEARHLQTLKQMKKTLPKIQEANILGDAHAVFAKIKAGAASFVPPEDPTQMYRIALEREHESLRFYQEQADAVGNLAQQGVFLLLAKEEKQHIILLENLIEFVGHPLTWVENGEFNHLLEEY